MLDSFLVFRGWHPEKSECRPTTCQLEQLDDDGADGAFDAADNAGLDVVSNIKTSIISSIKSTHHPHDRQLMAECRGLTHATGSQKATEARNAKSNRSHQKAREAKE